MSNSWDEMRKAKEDSYFAKKEQEALERLANRNQDKPRKSPVSGEPMEQVTIHGVVIDRCVQSGGIWLDAGELEQLMKIARDQGVKDKEDLSSESWLLGFFRTIGTGGK